MDLDNTIEDLDLVVLRFEDFGKDFIKAQKMSPDGFMQLALQLAFYKCNNTKTNPVSMESNGVEWTQE